VLWTVAWSSLPPVFVTLSTWRFTDFDTFGAIAEFSASICKLVTSLLILRHISQPRRVASITTTFSSFDNFWERILRHGELTNGKNFANCESYYCTSHRPKWWLDYDIKLYGDLSSWTNEKVGFFDPSFNKFDIFVPWHGRVNLMLPSRRSLERFFYSEVL